MSESKLGIADYPLAERRPELVRGRRGKGLADLTLDEVLSGEVEMEDLRITPDALLQQAEIARDANRATLAGNFERASEMADLPQEFIMEVYELLRPGRAPDKTALEAAAARLRDDYGAERLAQFVEEAAEFYERRGLFTFRF
ncbi:MAG: glycerol dehydratase [Alphaproteobacteria bacterium]|nr:glycerol dehydratase [Alphaproteobacteria bacterium]